MLLEMLRRKTLPLWVNEARSLRAGSLHPDGRICLVVVSGAAPPGPDLKLPTAPARATSCPTQRCGGFPGHLRVTWNRPVSRDNLLQGVSLHGITFTASLTTLHGPVCKETDLLAHANKSQQPLIVLYIESCIRISRHSCGSSYSTPGSVTWFGKLFTRSGESPYSSRVYVKLFQYTLYWVCSMVWRPWQLPSLFRVWEVCISAVTLRPIQKQIFSTGLHFIKRIWKI